MSFLITRRLVLDAFDAVLEQIASDEDASGSALSNLPSFRGFVDDLALVQSTEGRVYLARSLSGDDRYACCRHHYFLLGAVMPRDGFRALLSNHITLLESRPGFVHYSVLLYASREYDIEGELALDFRANGRSLFVFHFTFVPGYVVGSTEWTVALVARMQSRRDVLHETRLATADMADCSPQSVLFACLTGVTKAFGVQRIVGPSATNQISYADSKAERLTHSYDEFFRSVEANGPCDGFYFVETAPSDNPNRTESSHPARAQIQREIKAVWAKTAAYAWLRACASPRALTKDLFSVEAVEDEITRKHSQLVRDELNATRTELVAARQGLISAQGAISSLSANILKAEADNETLREEINRTAARFAAAHVKKRPLWRWGKSFERRVLRSGIFDEDWYLSENPDIAATGLDPIDHYLKFGAVEKRSPSRFFSTEDYLALNPDVAQSGINPLVHYCLYGAAEGRKTHRVLKSGIFDEEWYLSQYPDVAAAGLDPLAHYLKYGALQRRAPSRSFSTADYLALIRTSRDPA
jgi:uncharacterized protein VirK/YbjX